MARTAFTAPAHIVKQRNALGNTATQPDSAPSLGYGGMNLIDPRLVWNKYNSSGNGVACAAIGWPANGCILDATPAAASATNVAAAANVTSGTAMTLVSSSGNGIIVTSSAFTALPTRTVIPSGTLAVGAQMGYLSLGIRDITMYYDPTKAVTATLKVTGVSGGAGGAFIVRGWDLYGQPMAETITATSGATTVSGLKAWKWIASITPQFTDAHNYSFGTTLTVGLNLAADLAGYVNIWVNGSGYTANPSITVADTTSPATGTTGDVRGTTVLTNAHTLVYVNLSSARLTTTPLSQGMFGVDNFTQ